MPHAHSTSANSDRSGPTAAQRARDRTQRASVAALKRWGHADGVSGTAPARKAFLDKFFREADPDGLLSDAERAIRAERLRRAYFKSLAIRSAQVRRARSAPSSEPPTGMEDPTGGNR